MSAWAVPEKPVMTTAAEVLRVVIINEDRTSVLACLVAQAERHFGRTDLVVRNVRVVSVPATSSILATAEFSLTLP